MSVTRALRPRRRRSHDDHRWPAARTDRPRAVVAGGDLALTEAAAGELRRADYDVMVCPGWTDGQRCAVLDAGHCGLVDETDVVVDLFGADSPRSVGLLDGLRRNYPGVPVVASLYDDDIKRLPDLTDGILTLAQPVDRASLLDAVERALQRRRTTSGPAAEPASTVSTTETAATDTTATADPPKPRLRGLSHLIAFALVMVLGPVLVASALPAHRFVAGVYAAGLAGLFGCSALLHRNHWSPRALPWVRRLDHSMIFVFIASTYTPVVATSLDGRWSTFLLAGAWIGAVVGVGVSLFWLDAPRWVTSGAYLAVGWLAVAGMPALWSALEHWQFGLLALGGALFSLGAVVYARRRPDPWPTTFGYHEVFHALVVLGVSVHFVLVAGLVTA